MITLLDTSKVTIRLLIVRTFNCYNDTLGFKDMILVRHIRNPLYHINEIYNRPNIIIYEIDNVLSNLFVNYIKSIIKNQNYLL